MIPLFGFGNFVLGFLLAVLSLFLILLVLVQRGRGGGLTGALGGPGGQSAFGSKAGDLFTKITSVTALLWIGLCAIATATLGEKADPPDVDDFDRESIRSRDPADRQPISFPDPTAPDVTAETTSDSQMEALDQLISGDRSSDDVDAEPSPEEAPEPSQPAEESP